MISVILYGRNDAHGYNLHRRAALSLNCLAEILTDRDDEIVFVDYNTPDELPTFVEALADTLTERCLELIRVLRVPAGVHRTRFAGSTHLPVVEPVCRNVAARRSSPANRWLLSTNSDMILVPLTGRSLSALCGELADGHYGLPRFELPEWLWERLPRSDPSRAMGELARLGPHLRLDQPTLGHDWVRFDAPGDFQLVLRDDLFAIDGFDEEMVLGWHVDSNLARRLSIHRGPVGTVDDELAGYHCNHSRTPTVYHLGETRIENDLRRFYESVDVAALPTQRETWGLAEADVEEIDLDARGGFAAALANAIPPPRRSPEPSTSLEAGLRITYDSAHALPFVVDSIAVSPLPLTVAYVGANSALRGMLERFARELASDGSLEVVALETDDPTAAHADLFVVDLGLEQATASEADRDAHRTGTTRFPEELRRTLSTFQSLVALERERLHGGEHPRRFVLVNSATAFVDDYVLAHLDCTHATPHSGVRQGTVRVRPHDDDTSIAKQRQAARLVRWAARVDTPGERLPVRPGMIVDVGELPDFRGFGDGWATPDPTSIWTQGTSAELRLTLEQAPAGRHDLQLTFGRVGVDPGDALPVSLVINGSLVAEGRFPGGTRRLSWASEIPATAIDRSDVDVVLEFPERSAWLDERRLGLHVDSFGIIARHRSWRALFQRAVRRPRR